MMREILEDNLRYIAAGTLILLAVAAVWMCLLGLFWLLCNYPWVGWSIVCTCVAWALGAMMLLEV